MALTLVPDEIDAYIIRPVLPDNWPSSWPRPAFTSWKGTISFVLPSSQYAELRAYLAAPENRAACVGYLLRLPHEEMWRR